MVIDIIYAIIIIVALVSGFKRGLIVAVFSLAALVIGLAAAMKLSAVVASYIGKAVTVSDEWLPVISFAVVFLLVYLLVRWAAVVIEKTVKLTMLGWLNKLGGIVFYLALYTTIYSVILFYTLQTSIITPETKKRSVTYSFIQPWGPRAINGLGVAVPFFRNIFSDLEKYFGSLSEEIPEPR
jgi:membrane protein required for colicin V production